MLREKSSLIPTRLIAILFNNVGLMKISLLIDSLNRKVVIGMIEIIRFDVNPKNIEVSRI